MLCLDHEITKWFLANTNQADRGLILMAHSLIENCMLNNVWVSIILWSSNKNGLPMTIGSRIIKKTQWNIAPQSVWDKWSVDAWSNPS